MKKTFYSEISYILAQLILPLGAAMLKKANFGISMVIAPAFIISQKFDFMSFGMAEYLFQALLLVIFCIIVRKVRVKYLFSFVTAFIYGNVLDLWLFLLSFGEPFPIAVRVLLFIIGDLFTVAGVVLFFKSYIPPEVYELFVRGISEKYGFNMGKVKWIYDLTSLALSVGLSFLFFGELREVWFGTLIIAVINGPIISALGKFLDRRFDFKPALRVPKWLA